MKDKDKKYEQYLEDQYENLKPIAKESELIGKLTAAAHEHIAHKKPITIRVSVQDIEAIKIKAARLGLPYQTYLNMLIHKDAMNR